jgi:hypothetical protein
MQLAKDGGLVFSATNMKTTSVVHVSTGGEVIRKVTIPGELSLVLPNNHKDTQIQLVPMSLRPLNTLVTLDDNLNEVSRKELVPVEDRKFSASATYRLPDSSFVVFGSRTFGEQEFARILKISRDLKIYQGIAFTEGQSSSIGVSVPIPNSPDFIAARGIMKDKFSKQPWNFAAGIEFIRTQGEKNE